MVNIGLYCKYTVLFVQPNFLTKKKSYQKKSKRILFVITQKVLRII